MKERKREKKKKQDLENQDLESKFKVDLDGWIDE